MLLTALLLACSTEYGLSSMEPLASEGLDAPDAPGEPASADPSQQLVEPVEAWAVVPSEAIDDGSARQTRVVPGKPMREDSFTVGRDQATLTDVLFVVDNSVSMRAVLDQLDDGLAALTRDGVFPPRTRIAVTSTTPRDALDWRAPHREVRMRSVVRHDPGFAGLIDGARLERFRSLNGEGIHERMPLPGCDAWFAPTATVPGRADVSCLMAHTQIAETPHGIEAGLVALNQLLVLDADARPRPGASFNVVFISDTHDPGIAEGTPGYDDMVSQRPVPAELADKVLGDWEASGFRMHAIAPASPCSGEPWTGTSYFDAAGATGGVTLDVCTAEPTDYVALAQRIAELGSRAQAPVVALSAGAKQVDEVLVDGLPVGFAVGKTGRTVVLDGELSEESRDVRIRYRTELSGALPKGTAVTPAALPAGARQAPRGARR